MMKPSRVRIAVVWAAGCAALTCASAGSSAEWPAKVDPRVVAETEARGEAEFMILLDEQADLSAAPGLASKDERGRWVYETLTRTASRSQAPLIAWLEERGIPHRPYWIANTVWARAGMDAIAQLAERDDVRRLDANPRIALEFPEPAGQTLDPVPTTIEWGVLQVRAEQVWALGYDGSGVTIAGQDTGYEWSHPALIEHYRGWNGGPADHDYNWHDSIHSGGGSCGADSTEPCDDHGHGTHTMGTMTGDDGGSNRTGVAPGAAWIGCRNMDQGNGTPETYTECFQFFVAPTDVAGNNPDPQKSPHVINNSWLCPASEGCAADTLRAVVENTRAAGIVVVASAGNSGSGCGTINTPPATYQAAFTVGATDSSDEIAGFSSRGPVPAGAGELPNPKPDVSAPGVGVRSSVRGGGYGSSSGTSMAGPHVAGTVALLLDARPDLAGRVSEIEAIVRLSSVPRTTSQECGGIPGSQIPNPVYGHGRIDALEVVTGDADGDGFDNLADCSPVDATLWATPGAVQDLRLRGNALVTVLSWTTPAGGGTGIVRYDVLRSDEAADFSAPTCVAADTAENQAVDTEAADGIAFYLVRAVNGCGGTIGDGTARVAGSCPETP